MSLTSADYEENSNGKSGHNGSPGEQTCAKSGCHDSFAVNSGPGEVQIDVPGMTNWQYVPGQTYTINVTVSQVNRSLFGFGFEALLQSGANAGNLTAGVGSHALNATVASNVRRTITHLDEAGASANQHTFSFTWVAPSTPVLVSFYAVGNAANNNGSDSNDYIYTISQALTPLAAPDAPTIVANGDTDLCAGESVSLSVTDQNNVTFNWYDESDALLGSGPTLNVSEAGCYTVQAVNSGGTVQSLNTICTTLSIPDASFSGLTSFYCSNDSAVELIASSNNGTFSGTGVIGNSFDPEVAGAGTHNIIHEVTNQNGCSGQSLQTVVVGLAADPSFTVSSATVCDNADLLELIPVEFSGEFSGTGVEGDVFNPAIGVGIYEIFHSIGDAGCAQTASQLVQVLAAPEAGFTGLEEEYCSNEIGNLLVPLVEGGSFSGSGVVDAFFSPEAAGAGFHEISYSLEGANGCISIENSLVEVNQFVSADFSGLNDFYCQNEDAVILTPAEVGGFFSPEALDGIFDPAGGPGIFAIIYTNGLGSCEVSQTQFTEVLPIPDAIFSGLQNGYCTNAEVVLLEGSGSFSGIGVEGNLFNPTNAEIGENQIIHTVIGENGCQNSSTQTIFVYETANSDFSGLSEFYCPDQTSIELIALNPGGVFSGPGVDGSLFSPVAAGPGAHVVEYIVDLVGCFSASSDTVTVYDQPVVNVLGLLESYCADDEQVVLVASQQNVTIDGPGIVGDLFQPALAGAGIHEIECTYVDQNGCIDIWTGMVEVLVLPDPTVILDNNTLTALVENAEYTWIDCSDNLPIVNQTSSSFSPEISGSYALQISANGCDAVSECVGVTIIGVGEYDENGISIYPNPAIDLIRIETEVPSALTILGPGGNLIYSNDTPTAIHQIDLGALSAGVYHVIAVSEYDKLVSRFVVMK